MIYFKRLCLATLLAASPCVAFAASTITVKLDDTADGMDMSQNLGLGMGMKGDMSKSTMSVKINNRQAARGKVTFNVTNLSKTMIHEMLVAPIKDENTPLPFIAKDNKVDEDAAKDLGEVSELDPGKSGSVTFDMKPGKYILYCNVPAHYMAGMWTVIEVK